MTNLSQAKSLGSIGSILAFIPLVSVVGFVLMLAAVNDISVELKDRSIFNNALIAVALQIVGVVVGAFLFFAGMASSVLTGGIGMGFGFFGGLALFWVFLLASAIFLRKSYDSIATGLGVSAFKTAALLYLIGAALVIVFGLGLVLVLVGEVFQAIGFFSLPESPAQPQATVAPAAAPAAAPQPAGYCVNCGAPADASAKFCRNCGRPL